MSEAARGRAEAQPRVMVPGPAPADLGGVASGTTVASGPSADPDRRRSSVEAARGGLAGAHAHEAPVGLKTTRVLQQPTDALADRERCPAPTERSQTTRRSESSPTGHRRRPRRAPGTQAGRAGGRTRSERTRQDRSCPPPRTRAFRRDAAVAPTARAPPAQGAHTHDAVIVQAISELSERVAGHPRQLSHPHADQPIHLLPQRHSTSLHRAPTPERPVHISAEARKPTSDHAAGR